MSIDSAGSESTRRRTSRSTRERPARAPRHRSARVATLPQLLAAAVDGRPDGIAIETADTSITYTELDRRSSRLARVLVQRGLGPEDLVAIAVTRSLESVLFVWAVAKSGAAFVPIDPDYPAERVRYMLDDSGAKAGLTTHRAVDGLPTTVPWIVLEDVERDAASMSSEPIAAVERTSVLRPSNLAYVIYTSGSTGAPKGVAGTHSGLQNLAESQRQTFGITADSRTLHFASPSFDAAVLELLLAVGAAATMVVVPTGIVGGDEFADVLRRHRVTHAFVTPAALASAPSHDLPDFDAVMVGGEAYSADLVARWSVGRRFYNVYGPTETTCITTSSAPLDPHGPMPIGTPLNGVRAYVVDSRLRTVPVGVVGELYLAGPAVARAYHRRGGLSAARFVADPWAPDGVAARMYRTGDTVRVRPDGSIDYVGRNDSQVKVRGFRIELGEIDAALEAHDSVDFAASKVHTTADGVDALVGYVLPAEGRTVDVREVLTFVAQSLARHMVPQSIEVLDRIPLTPVGKLDRNALPAPTFETVAFRSPVTEMERAVAETFAEVLGVPRIGLDDHFFDIGGNSLSATQVASRLGARTKSRISARLVFEAPTVVGLASRVEGALGAGDDALELGPEVRPDAIPLSLAQQRMWFLQNFDPASPANNIPAALRIDGPIDVTALREAVVDLQRRHESLRTVYPDQDGVGYQVVVPVERTGVALRYLSITETAVASHVARVALQPFDLATSVPLRVELIALGPEVHVLVVVLHHICADGASVGPLIGDLVSAYLARSSGQEPGWEPLRVQYADYSLWQRKLLGSESDPSSLASRQLDYWTATLADLPDRIELPTDKARPAEASGVGGTFEFELDAAVHASLTDLARACDATPFMVVHTAFAILLSKIAATRDVVVGTPVAGRGHEDLDALVGMFVNTLALRVDVDPSLSFVELLEHVRERDLGAYAHAELPFERLVEVLDPVRSAGHHPLFQVALFFQNLEQTAFELPGTTVSVVDPGVSVAKFDLQLTITPRFDDAGAPAAMSATFTYAADLFERATVRTLAERLAAVLNAAVADPQTIVGDIGILTAGERADVVHTWNDTAHPVPERTLLDLYRARVRRTPDARAIVSDRESITYGEFDERVQRVARLLVERGVGPDVLVGLAVRRSVDLVVGMYAVLEAGGAFVPLDPAHPADRTAHILDTARPLCVLSTTADRTALPAVVAGTPVDIVDIDTVAVDLHVRPSRHAETRVHRDSLAYVIFTSGSTGKPKGVGVAHRAIENQMSWMTAYYGLDSDDVYLQKTATTFDVSLWGYFLPLRTGASMVLMAPDGHRDPLLVADVIDREQVTVTDFVPSMLGVFAAHAAADRLTSLRHVFVIGEALPPDTADAFAAVSSARLHNLYGPTEAAVSVTQWEVESTPQSEVAKTVPIGVPQWNVRVHVLDARLRPVPPGVAGELYLSGVQLARGYVSRPDLTADRFVADPNGFVGELMYRTGDLVRWIPGGQGALDYIGRTDFQVKFRGQRIELGDIESALLLHPSVSQAVVLVAATSTGDQLAGYVVPAPGTDADSAELIVFVRDTLPSYMVPTSIVVLDALPLGTSGKLDRAALPSPEFRVNEYLPPTTAAEEIVAEVYSQVLGLPRVGTDDNFFDLGGNSLVATQVVARIGAALDTRVPVRALFEAPTVAALALRLDAVSDDARIPLVAQVRPDVVPLSLAQQRMWFLNRFDTTSFADNLPIAMKLVGDLNTRALAQAVVDLVWRHEPLRTRYPDHDGVPRQLVLPADRVELDLEPRHLAECDLAADLADFVSAGFDVAEHVPLRVRIYAVGDDEYVLAVVLHHIAGDGFSMRPLARDLMTAYVARTAGQPPSWPPLDVQYADFALWQRTVLGTEQDPDSLLSRQTEHWIAALAGLADRLELPTDRPRPRVASHRGATLEFSLDGGAHAGLNQIARQHHATLFMVLHAALAVLLGRISAATDIAIGTPVAGRGEQALDDLIGMFVNTLVLRTELDRADEPFDDLLDRVRASDLAAFGNADVPFEHLVDIVAPERVTDRNPLFQVALVFQNLGEQTLDLPGLQVARLELESNTSKFDLQFTVSETIGAQGESAGLACALTYATDLFDADTARTLSRRFERILRAVVHAPSTPIGDLEILDDFELESVVRAPSVPERPVVLTDLLSAAVAAAPDSDAVSFDGRAITYAELDARSSRLARVLLDAGVGPGDLVALALSRSIESIVALWAVAKSGAAFVSVDPNYPVDRVAHMIEDAEPSLGVTVSSARSGLPDAITWLVLDDNDIRANIASYSADPVERHELRRPLHVTHPAYIIYTSGSTGLPKGVVVTHAGLANFAAEQRDRYVLSRGDRALHFASPSFDASILELLLALAASSTLVVAPPGIYGGDELAALLREERVTHAFITPAALATVDPDGLPDLRVLVAGGEACPPELVARWTESGTGREFFNGYGPTETTIMTNISAPLSAGAPITIGGPIRGMTSLVLDDRLGPVPVGVSGEHYIAGIQLAQGYHRRPGLTAGRFVANPYGTHGERMYRTGDVVRWTRDLQIEYVGRSDFQVKIRGFRIELGEIEAVLASHPDVEFATTTVRDLASGNAAIVGYVLPVAGRTVDVRGLVEFVANKVPAHMVPSSIVVLDVVPLTPVGKLDRSALPEPVFRTVDRTEPVTETEVALAELFADVLGLDSVSTTDSFFALGGDSIVSIQLVSRAKARGIGISPREVFENKTVQAIARVATRTADADVVVLAELPGGGVGDIPLTPAVRFMVERGGSYDRFEQTLALELPAGIEHAQLVQVLAAVIDRHDMLRATLVLDGERPVLRTSPAGTVDVETLIDRTPYAEDIDADELIAVADDALEHALAQLNPSKGHVIRFAWLDPVTGEGSTSSRTGRLIVVAHHMVVDGVSWRILIPDFVAAWLAVAAGQKPHLDEPGTSFRTWSHALQDHASHTDDVELWESVLDGPDPQLSTRAFDPSIDVVSTVQKVSVRLPHTVTDAVVTTIPAMYRTGAGDALIAGLALALARWRRDRGVEEMSSLIGLEGHGREESVVPGAELSRTVGWFTSMFPARLDLDGIDLDDAFAGGASAGAAVKRVKEQLLALPDKGIGYGIRRYLGDDDASARLAGGPRQVSFNYLGRVSQGDIPDAMAGLGWLPASDLGELDGRHDDDMPAMATVDINAIVLGGELSAGFGFPATLMGRDDVQELADTWVEALTAIARHSGSVDAGGLTPSDLDLVQTTQADIDVWEEAYGSVADVWPLTALQGGFAYHAMLAESGADVYTTQLVLHLHGDVDVRRLQAAGNALLTRHANLRTAFRPDAHGSPVQIVVDGLDVPWRDVDAIGASRDDVDAILREDQRRGFDLAEPPLVRFVAVRTASDTWALGITCHHILLDGWSMPILLKDLLILYATHADVSVLEPATPFRAYLTWLSEQPRDAALAAWRTALGGFTEPTLLTHALPAVAGGHGRAEYRAELSEASSTALSEYASHIGVTVNTLIQGAWGILLARITGHDDVVFGTTVSGRPPVLDGVEQMVGLFINTLPVRVVANPDRSVESILTSLQQASASLLDHHHVGLSEIQDSTGLQTLFDTLVVFESYPIDRSALSEVTTVDGVTVTGVETVDAAHYPLSIVAVLDGVLRFDFEYSTDLFDDDRIRRLAERYVRVLEGLGGASDTRSGNVDVLWPDERTDLIARWGGAAPAPKTLADIVAAAATRAPDSVALVYEDRSVTYRELDEHSSRIARMLIERGLGPEDTIACGIARSIESVTAVWAVAKTGAAFVPVDPRYPAARVEHMLVDSGSDVGLTVVADRSSLPDAVDWIVLDDPDTASSIDSFDAAPVTDSDRVSRLRVENTAYVIYTSGSTGVPKGVVVTHGGLSAFAASQTETFRVDSDSVALHAMSPSFDASVSELMLAFDVGATLVITPATMYGGDELTDYLRRHRVSHLAVTPATVAGLDPSLLPDFRCLSVGGEAWPPELMERWAEFGAFHNLYGPTEGTVVATISEAMTAGDRISIGSPVRGTRAVVLDPRLRPVMDGVVGELYLAGPKLARGYRARAGLTAAAFVADPFESAGRLYRTGDLVRWNGPVLEYVGRADKQIKIRGFRVELGEIDAALTDLPGIDYATTVVRDTDNGSQALVSYVLASDSVDPDALKTDLATVLPRHMIPAAVTVLDELPLTGSGKVNVDALPDPVFTRAEHRQPRTELERTVARLFADVLSLDRVGLGEDFFELGGTSLSATALVSQLRAVTGAQVRVQSVLDTRTVDGIAARIVDDAAVASRSLDVVLPIRSGGASTPLFCVHPMLGLAWGYAGLLPVLDPDVPVYGVQTPATTEVGFEVRSIDELADRYASDIDSERPHGPLSLLGWSIGGVLAHAIAVRLQQRGRVIEQLTLLDSLHTVDTGAFEGEVRAILESMGLPIGTDVDITSMGSDVARLFETNMPDDMPDLDGAQIERLFAAAVDAARAMDRYRPGVFRGDLTFCTAGIDHQREDDAAWTWKPYIDGAIETATAPVAHEDMLSPAAIDVVGRVLRH
ncbi:non-ribosomal peptide synthetase [Rhodococcoides kyotonense]|uniref:Non-ribosomal peptide synthase domain TIGR01720/amino acid adenylation domain-containing protein n=1 Tax=Rhodococcoides kyotonense TaxID=398843 RepID=A0A239N0F5_9NOCA|nr:non-ribosomal peptide synthetase [Rhodococcus kyotonensis]SNT48375.1 non-ribosomal peptide synthase domain TIGR01720/amino acid adenylation domain-containing protein [Rhodococcus kyotonensis]